MSHIPPGTLLQSIANGFVLSWIYILIAVGLMIIFSIMRILQFAHGEVYMLGAYTVYFFSVTHGLNYFVALLLSIVVGLVVGLILERIFFRPLGGDFTPTIIVALGLMLVLQAAVTVAFGGTPKVIPSFAPNPANILGIMLGSDRIITVGISIFIILLLYLFLKRSKYGQALTAAAQHREASLLMGINPILMSIMAMVIGSALAALAGGLTGAILPINPFMGGPVIIKGLIIIILGGVGSLLGVVVGGLIMGFVDGVLPVLSNSALAAMVPLFLVAIILMLKPQGLFGHE